MNMHIFCMNTFGKGSIEGENSKCHQTRLHGGISVLVSLKTCYFTITYTKAPVFIIKQCIAICLAKVPPEATVFLALRPVPVSASLLDLLSIFLQHLWLSNRFFSQRIVKCAVYNVLSFYTHAYYYYYYVY